MKEITNIYVYIFIAKINHKVNEKLKKRSKRYSKIIQRVKVKSFLVFIFIKILN